MSWAMAGGYVVAVGVAIAGALLRFDARVETRLAGAVYAPRPKARGEVLARIGRFANASRALRWVAGREPGERADEVRAGTTLSLMFGALVVALLLGGGRVVATLALASVLGAVARTLPRFVAARQRAAREKRAGSATPELIDLLAVTVAAGLSPRLALERAARAAPEPLRSELADVERAVALGTPWRTAFQAVADRTELGELRRLATVLDRSERLGIPLAEVLRRFAARVREKRRVEQEERARRAPVLMLLPLVLCVLPAFLVAAVAPALIVAARGLG